MKSNAPWYDSSSSAVPTVAFRCSSVVPTVTADIFQSPSPVKCKALWYNIQAIPN